MVRTDKCGGSAMEQPATISDEPVLVVAGLSPLDGGSLQIFVGHLLL